MWLKAKKHWAVTLDLKPVAKGRARVTRKGWAFTPQKTRDAEKLLRRLLVEKNPPCFFGPIALSVIFCFKRPKSVKRKYHTVRPDGDNLFKSICDGANGILYKDDAQICQGYFQKQYGDKDSVSIQVLEITDG